MKSATLLLGLVIGIAMLGAPPVRANSITEDFSIHVSSGGFSNIVVFPGTSFNNFDPANGTLNDFTFTLTGDLRWSSNASGARLDSHALLNGSGFKAPAQSFPDLGLITVDQSFTDTDPTDLASVTGAGTSKIQELFEEQKIGPDTLHDATDAGLTGTITFDFTPAPEPATLALFGLPLVALGFLRRRQKIA